ncbi:hypothetical protein BTVI_74178 [Pitangus sulphuratus]|nr:hypothetical protein BTVI_74178 [Pitangus sulphuratus]
MFLLIGKCQPSSPLLAAMKLQVSVCSVLTVWPELEMYEIRSPNFLTMPARLLEAKWPIFKDPGKTYLAVAEVSLAVDK